MEVPSCVSRNERCSSDQQPEEKQPEKAEEEIIFQNAENMHPEKRENAISSHSVVSSLRQYGIRVIPSHSEVTDETPRTTFEHQTSTKISVTNYKQKTNEEPILEAQDNICLENEQRTALCQPTSFNQHAAEAVISYLRCSSDQQPGKAEEEIIFQNAENMHPEKRENAISSHAVVSSFRQYGIRVIPYRSSIFNHINFFPSE
ncbi:hypothetical protein CDAR_92361 [Caerostris darwini]|uniref:Uncharacterized protein n=1 Tax=Caerostris darwini TaxID=1538125 RepID=A0AAV4PJE2_9ARAC|nr:hypothetical protein CDAR_92361 [Caerostris darwini]